MGSAGLSCTIETFTAGDGYRWRYRRYPDGESYKAHVVCLHGVQSHGGWYEYSCNQLCDAGYQVHFLDRRGSGMNEMDRGDAPSFRRLLDDVAEYLGPLRESKRMVFLVAISWGGKLGVALQRRHPGQVDGLALLCPGFFPKVRHSLGQRCAIAAARLINPQKRFPIPLNDPELFTDNPKWLQFLRDDPLSLKEATARLLLESARLDGYLRFVTRYVRVPILLMLAEKDRIIDNFRTRRYVESLPATDKETIEYAGARHTLEFEADPERFVKDLVQWLDQRA